MKKIEKLKHQAFRNINRIYFISDFLEKIIQPLAKREKSKKPADISGLHSPKGFFTFGHWRDTFRVIAAYELIWVHVSFAFLCCNQKWHAGKLHQKDVKFTKKRKKSLTIVPADRRQKLYLKNVFLLKLLKRFQMSPFYNDIQILKVFFFSILLSLHTPPKSDNNGLKKSRAQTNGIINMEMFSNNKTN